MAVAPGSVLIIRRPLQLHVLFCIVFLITTVAASPSSSAAAAAQKNATTWESDEEYWAQRTAPARAYSLSAHASDPNRFNQAVHRATTTHRRSLMGQHRGGPCVATNPIDRCWRCRPNWADDRQHLARCAMGFGHNALGGLGGRTYVVTDPSDDPNALVHPKKGTLRYGVIQDDPLWIVFSKDMVIRLSQELIVNSYKTIDGRGAQVHITGGQVTLQGVRHVILHNVRIHHSVPHSGSMIRDSKHHYGFRTRSDGDGVSMMSASNIWIDHVSMWQCSDGLVDAVSGSSAVTISNSHFTRHDHVMLFGASNSSPEDSAMQITVAFNHFGKGLVQRMPRCRFGFFHVVNNDYTHWRMYAIGGNRDPTIISQGNRFVAPNDANAKEVTKREYAPYNEYKDWVWKSQGDVFMNGAFFNESGGRNERTYGRLDFIPARDGSHVGRLTRFAGTLDCHVGRPC